MDSGDFKTESGVIKCPKGWLRFGEAKCVGVPEKIMNKSEQEVKGIFRTFEN